MKGIFKVLLCSILLIVIYILLNNSSSNSIVNSDTVNDIIIDSKENAVAALKENNVKKNIKSEHKLINLHAPKIKQENIFFIADQNLEIDLNYVLCIDNCPSKTIVALNGTTKIVKKSESIAPDYELGHAIINSNLPGSIGFWNRQILVFTELNTDPTTIIESMGFILDQSPLKNLYIFTYTKELMALDDTISELRNSNGIKDVELDIIYQSKNF